MIYNEWNVDNPNEMRSAKWRLGVINDLSNIDQDMVGLEWRRTANGPALRQEEVRFMDIRICLQPENFWPEKNKDTQDHASQSH